MDEEGAFFGARRGWALRKRFWALDSYGLLLLMIMLSLIVAAVPTEGRENLMAVLRTVVLAGTFLFALHTSGANRWMYYASVVLIAIAVSASVIVDANTKTGAAIDAFAALLLVLAGLFVIGRRFAAHPVITGQSVLAAICIYLLLGLAYAGVYGVIGALDPVALFGPTNLAQNNVVRMYYSFITLCTVGYGDFVPYANFTRMVAVTEALVGQVYLVTIVALLVSHVGHERRRRDRSKVAEPPE
jgi:ion channel